MMPRRKSVPLHGNKYTGNYVARFNSEPGPADTLLTLVHIYAGVCIPQAVLCVLLWEPAESMAAAVLLAIVGFVWCDKVSMTKHNIKYIPAMVGICWLINGSIMLCIGGGLTLFILVATLLYCMCKDKVR